MSPGQPPPVPSGGSSTEDRGRGTKSVNATPTGRLSDSGNSRASRCCVGQRCILALACMSTSCAVVAGTAAAKVQSPPHRLKPPPRAPIGAPIERSSRGDAWAQPQSHTASRRPGTLARTEECLRSQGYHVQMTRHKSHFSLASGRGTLAQGEVYRANPSSGIAIVVYDDTADARASIDGYLESGNIVYDPSSGTAVRSIDICGGTRTINSITDRTLPAKATPIQIVQHGYLGDWRHDDRAKRLAIASAWLDDYGTAAQKERLTPSAIAADVEQAYSEGTPPDLRDLLAGAAQVASSTSF
jgi:hypothetical protein